MSNKYPKYGAETELGSLGFLSNTLDDLYRRKSGSEVELHEYHRVGFNHIIWFQEPAEHYINLRQIKINPNSLLFIREDVPHRYSADQHKGKYVLFSDSFFCVSKPTIEYLNSSTLFDNMYSIVSINNPKFEHIVESYFSLFKRQPERSRDMYLSISRILSHNLMLEAEREHAKFRNLQPKSVEVRHITMFRSLVNEYFKKEKQVQFYADKLQISVKSLNKILLNSLGKSAVDFIREKTFLESIRLLKHSTLSVKEIAFELGFGPVYFVKFFKKHSGNTPAKFREDCIRRRHKWITLQK